MYISESQLTFNVGMGCQHAIQTLCLETYLSLLMIMHPAKYVGCTAIVTYRTLQKCQFFILTSSSVRQTYHKIGMCTHLHFGQNN